MGRSPGHALPCCLNRGEKKAQMSKNRRIRVFVSSTFRDMVEERDELMTQTWPELRRFCRERQVELVEVDLRWGSVLQLLQWGPITVLSKPLQKLVES